LLDYLLESLKRLRAEYWLSIDQESRRAANTDGLSSAGRRLNQFRVFARIQALVESLAVQPDVRRKLFQIIFIKGALVLAALALEEQVMVFPEGILIRRALAGFRSPKGFLSQEGEVIIPDADLPAGNIFSIDLATRASGKFAAEWSLEIAEFQYRDRSRGLAFEMLGLLDQLVHRLQTGSDLRWIGRRRRGGDDIAGWDRNRGDRLPSRGLASNERATEIASQQADDQSHQANDRGSPGMNVYNQGWWFFA
jgi:hypothetical protein